MKVFQSYQELKDYYIRNWVMQVPSGDFCLVDENDKRRTDWDYIQKERNLMVKNDNKEYFVLKKF